MIQPVVNDVLCCGLPCSGNDLLRRLVDHLKDRSPVGVDDYTRTGIWHGWNNPPIVNESDCRILIPVRCPKCQKASLKRRKMSDFDEKACRAKLFQWIGAHGFPVKIISYEAMVRDPEATGADLSDWLGVKWKGWPEKVVDANAKYQ